MNFSKTFFIVNFNEFGVVSNQNTSDALQESLENACLVFNKNKVVVAIFFTSQ